MVTWPICPVVPSADPCRRTRSSSGCSTAGTALPGKPVRMSSPQGRFADGAATLNGQTITGIDAPESISSTGSMRATSCTCISDCSANSGFGATGTGAVAQRSARHGDRDRSSASPVRRRASSSPQRKRTISAADSVRTRSSIPLMELTSSGEGSAAAPSRSGRPARPEGGRRDWQRVPVRAVVPCRNPSVDREVLRAWAMTTSGVGRWSHSRTARRWVGS